METFLFLGGIFALQTVTDVPPTLSRRLPHVDFHTWRFRLQAWSQLAGLYALAVYLNNGFSVALISFVVYHLLKGFFSTVDVRIQDRPVLLFTFLLVTPQIIFLWNSVPLPIVYATMTLPLIYLIWKVRGKGWQTTAYKLIWAMAGSVAILGQLTTELVVPSNIHPIFAGGLMFCYAILFRYVSAAIWDGR